MTFEEIEKIYRLGTHKKSEIEELKSQVELLDRAIESLKNNNSNKDASYSLQIMLGFGSQSNITTSDELYYGMAVGLNETKKLYLREIQKMEREFETLIAI